MKKRVMLMPLYLWTIVFVALPMLYMLAISFVVKGETYGVTNVFTLTNYVDLVAPVNVNIFLRSMRMALETTAITLLVSYPFACAMMTCSHKQRSLLMMLIVVPFWTSALLRIYGWMIFFRSNGLLNIVLKWLGLAPVKFLYTDGATLFGMVYTFLPFMILPIFNALERQDIALREAARDLGASPLRTFVTVVFPLTLPGVVSGITMVLVPSIGLFFISDLMGGGTQMLMGSLINHAFHAGRNWPLGAALSMVMVGMTAITLSIYKKALGGEQMGVF